MILFIKLIIAHIITDFYLQPNKWVKHKEKYKIRSEYLYLHVLITAGVAWLIVWDFSLWPIPLIIFISHLLIDIWKLALPKTLFVFLLDQIMHLAAIVYCIVIIDPKNEIVVDMNIDIYKAMVIAIGYLIITKPAGVVIGMFTAQWQEELIENSNRDSLEKAGIWIGILERILILTFVLLLEYQAIGFLIAAKSILRYGDKEESNPRKQTEYVLIGTLISFTIAFMTGLGVLYLLNLRS